MSISTTTLTNAISANDTYIVLGAVTAVSAPVSTTGAGFTYLYMEGEIMFAQTVNSTTKAVTVLRGQLGSRAVAHAAATPVLIGGPSDLPNFTPSQAVEVPAQPNNYLTLSPPVVSAATITIPGPLFHVTGSTQMVTFTLPAGLVLGRFTMINDCTGGGLTWTTGGNIAAAGSVSTAATSVDFTWDPPSSKWIPGRVT